MWVSSPLYFGSKEGCILIIFPLTRKLIFRKVSTKQKTNNKKQDFINGEFEDIEDENDRKF